MQMLQILEEEIKLHGGSVFGRLWYTGELNIKILINHKIILKVLTASLNVFLVFPVRSS